MKSAFQQVRDFHLAAELPVREKLTKLTDPERALRERLEEEEHQEVMDELASGDNVALAEELADKVIVACGTALFAGIDLDAVIAEKMLANMTKFHPATGKPLRRADGKILKGPFYRPPNIRKALGLE